jgi:uncharacterized protein YrrD
MKKSSEVLGLRVIGIREGQENGVTQDFMIDTVSKNMKYLLLKSSVGYGFRVMKVGDIEAIGADYVITSTVRNAINIFESKEIMEEVEKGYYILGATVLSSTGDIIGIVSDFSFDEKTGELETIMMDNGNEFGAEKIATLAGRMVFIDPRGEYTAQAVREASAEEVSGEEAQGEPAIEVAEEVAAEEPVAEKQPVVEAEAPVRSALEQESINFLLGKTVKNEVVSDDGMFRLEAGAELTEDIINLAEQHDAILTLTLSV